MQMVKRKGRADKIVIFHGSKQISTGTSDYAQAGRVLAEYLSGEQKGMGPPERGCTDRNPSIGSIISAFSFVLEDRFNPKLARHHRISCNNLLPFWRDRRLYDISEETCREYLRSSEMGSEDRAAVGSTTIRRELALLKRMVTEYCGKAGMAVPTFFLPPRNAARREYLRRSELRRLLLAVRRKRSKMVRRVAVSVGDRGRREDVPFPELADALSRFALIASYTGIRLSVLLRLRWEPNDEGGDIELEDGRVYQIAGGDAVKNKRYPPVSLTPSMRRLLRRWRTADAAAGHRGHVIHDAQGKPILSHHFNVQFAKAAVDAGLGKRVSPHMFRHTCATWLAEGDALPDEAAEFMGHTVAEFEKTYAEVEPHFSCAASMALAGWGRPADQRSTRPGSPPSRAADPAG